MSNLLIEIGTEELPPVTQKLLAISLHDNIARLLQEKNLEFAGGRYFATPRRLAVIIKNLAEQQPDTNIYKKGPATNIALDNSGNYTKAAVGFAASCNISVDDLDIEKTDKGSWIVANSKQTGKATVELLPEIIEHALKKLPIAKKMRWGSGLEEFIRPVHWSIVLFGDAVIPCKIFRTTSSNITYGHRFLAPEPITIENPIYYESSLLDQQVVASFEKRKESIVQQINELCEHPVLDKNLLDFVTAIVEWPKVLIANFDKKFLRLPSEVLILAMQHHQKCFAIRNSVGDLLPQFIIVSNMDLGCHKNIIAGNERVMHARLEDAEFYYKRDLEFGITAMQQQLDSIVFEEKLGSMQDKVTRITDIAVYIAEQLQVPIEDLKKACALCKADLLSDMVAEFSELQGIMGAYYAANINESRDVALAIKEHYLPRSANDSLPSSTIGVILALADRIDSIVSMAAIGKMPTGDKDPFGIRRQAIAVLNILINKHINLDLYQLLKVANNLHENYNADLDKLKHFFLDRFVIMYREKEISHTVIQAAVALQILNPLDLYYRVQAINDFIKSDVAANIIANNKRIKNILAKNNANNNTVNSNLLTEIPEKQLVASLEEIDNHISPLLKTASYTEILLILGQLELPINEFFNNIMVMCDDEKIRNNRIAILQKTHNLFLQVADLSYL